MSKNCVYQILIHKLMKTKKYLKRNLKKKFISSNFISYILLIFFIIKFNKELYFCVNYCKFNAIIKRNRYSILFIEKILVKVMNCKYVIKLNIITVFNKLHMHSNSKNLIIFIIFMKVYKYYVLSFDLTNESVNY